MNSNNYNAIKLHTYCIYIYIYIIITEFRNTFQKNKKMIYI